jgi:hypothetical protein
LRGMYDLMLLDVPPISLSADAELLIGAAGVTLDPLTRLLYGYHSHLQHVLILVGQLCYAMAGGWAANEGSLNIRSDPVEPSVHASDPDSYTFMGCVGGARR